MTWKVYETNPVGFRFANIENEKGKLIFQSLHSQMTPDDTRQAVRDAHRAAAAPDMYVALELLLGWAREHTGPRDDNSPHDLLVAATAALAKADGVA